MKKSIKAQKVFGGITAAALALSLLPLTPPEVVTATPQTPRVSVHDPSIFKDPGDGTYYVLGSHIASASSENLISRIVAMSFCEPRS